MDEITINGIVYIPKNATPGSIRIVILPRGFVYVGRFEQDGSTCTLHNAKNIRRWGTAHGLGELAQDGPLSKTILDDCGIVIFHELAAISQIVCNAERWDRVV